MQRGTPRADYARLLYHAEFASSNLENTGFSKANPWLPIKPPQASRSMEQQKNKDSVLSFYKVI